MKSVIAIDMGFAAVGIACFHVAENGSGKLHGAHAFKTKKNAQRRKGLRVADDDAERCRELTQWLEGMVDYLAGRPAGAIVELPSGGAQGARANRCMGMATGVVVTFLTMRGIPTEWITPQAVKKAATGRIYAKKEEMIARAWQRFPLGNAMAWEKEHIADACWTFEAGKSTPLVQALMRIEETTNGT